VVVNRRVLVRYRVMAYTTAVLLILLVFVAIPLQFAAGEPDVAKVVGTLHGYLYLVYLAAALDLTRKLRVPLGWMLLVLLAGTVPFCAFVAERKLTKFYDRTVVPAPGVGLLAGGDHTGP
jgi:integral membrane protein